MTSVMHSPQSLSSPHNPTKWQRQWKGMVKQKTRSQKARQIVKHILDSRTPVEGNHEAFRVSFATGESSSKETARELRLLRVHLARLACRQRELLLELDDLQEEEEDVNLNEEEMELLLVTLFPSVCVGDQEAIEPEVSREKPNVLEIAHEISRELTEGGHGKVVQRRLLLMNMKRRAEIIHTLADLDLKFEQITEQLGVVSISGNPFVEDALQTIADQELWYPVALSIGMPPPTRQEPGRSVQRGRQLQSQPHARGASQQARPKAASRTTTPMKAGRTSSFLQNTESKRLGLQATEASLKGGASTTDTLSSKRAARQQQGAPTVMMGKRRLGDKAASVLTKPPLKPPIAGRKVLKSTNGSHTRSTCQSLGTVSTCCEITPNDTSLEHMTTDGDELPLREPQAHLSCAEQVSLQLQNMTEARQEAKMSSSHSQDSRTLHTTSSSSFPSTQQPSQSVVKEPPPAFVPFQSPLQPQHQKQYCFTHPVPTNPIVVRQTLSTVSQSQASAEASVLSFETHVTTADKTLSLSQTPSPSAHGAHSEHVQTPPSPSETKSCHQDSTWSTMLNLWGKAAASSEQRELSPQRESTDEQKRAQLSGTLSEVTEETDRDKPASPDALLPMEDLKFFRRRTSKRSGFQSGILCGAFQTPSPPPIAPAGAAPPPPTTDMTERLGEPPRVAPVVKDSPGVASVTEEPRVASVAEEPRVASVAEEPRVASVAEEPRVALSVAMLRSTSPGLQIRAVAKEQQQRSTVRPVTSSRDHAWKEVVVSDSSQSACLETREQHEASFQAHVEPQSPSSNNSNDLSAHPRAPLPPAAGHLLYTNQVTQPPFPHEYTFRHDMDPVLLQSGYFDGQPTTAAKPSSAGHSHDIHLQRQQPSQLSPIPEAESELTSTVGAEPESQSSSTHPHSRGRRISDRRSSSGGSSYSYTASTHQQQQRCSDGTLSTQTSLPLVSHYEYPYPSHPMLQKLDNDSWGGGSSSYLGQYISYQQAMYGIPQQYYTLDERIPDATTTSSYNTQSPMYSSTNSNVRRTSSKEDTTSDTAPSEQPEKKTMWANIAGVFSCKPQSAKRPQRYYCSA